MNAISNMPIRIEKGIPLPNTASRSKYPFAAMEVGDCFYAAQPMAKVRAGVEYYRKSNPSFKASIRTEGAGSRCWRIA